MSPRISPPFSSFVRSLAGLFVVAAVVSGCVTAAVTGAPGSSGAPTSSATPNASTPVSPAASPAGSSSANGFYLRAWQTQALAPQYGFGSLPIATIAGGKYINGMVAIPAIYPGPIYVGLSASPISAAGIDAIVAEARADGLLGDKTDFSGTLMPGAVTAHIELVVNGVTHDLTGSLPTDNATAAAKPGTEAAFEAFWNRISSIDTWLAADIGQSDSYSPSSVAVMVMPPADAASGITPQEKPWPLSGTFAKFGSPMGVAGYRCGVVSGADLGTLLPVVQASNALTRFVDSAKAKMSLQVRVLVPGESSPCA